MVASASLRLQGVYPINGNRYIFLAVDTYQTNNRLKDRGGSMGFQMVGIQT